MYNISSYNAFGVPVTMVIEFIELLGVEQDELGLTQTANRLKEILQYFIRFENPRYELLKVLNKKPSFDSFETVYNYVQLAKELIYEISQLDPNDFTEDIQKELANKYLTIETINKIETDASKILASEPENQKYIQILKKIQDIKKINSLLLRYI